MRFRKLTMVFLTLCAAVCVAQQVMDNSTVIKMHAAGLSDDIIVSTVNSSAGNYSTSADDLIALKKAGIGDKVISAMIGRNSVPTPAGATSVVAANSSDDPTQVHTPGIYILAAGLDKTVRLTKLDHVVPKAGKTSGTAAMVFTYGIKKAHFKVIIDGPKANVQTLDTSPVFYAYIPEDNATFGGSSVSVKDFALVKFDVHGEQREINTETVGMWSGATAGFDEKSRQGFTSEMVKPGVYKLTLLKPLPAGEYAFQQSGSVGTTQAQQNTGSYFDFGVVAQK